MFYKPGNYLSVLMYTRPVFQNSANNLNVKNFRIEMDFKRSTSKLFWYTHVCLNYCNGKWKGRQVLPLIERKT